MDFYNINIECMKTNRKSLYQSLMEADDSKFTNRTEEITSTPSRAGIPVVAIKYQGQNYRLNSSYNPIEEAKKWADQYSFHHLTNIVSMFGFGNGIFVRELVNRIRDKDTLIIYEPCADLFIHVLHQYDITDLLSDSRIHIAIEGINEIEYHLILQAMTDITNYQSQIICVHPRFDKIFPESCVLFWKEIKEILYNTQIQINTTIIFGERFIENTLNNIISLKDCNTIDDLKAILPHDIPAIVVAAGPSVEKNIEELKRAKGKAVIIAVDRILDYLLDMGLEPDFVVTLDPIKPIEYFSKREDISIPLLYFIEANSQILQVHKGKKILCNCGDFLSKSFQDLGKNPPRLIQSASVATVAFSACVYLGFKTIILVGQDLAYSGKHTHAGGNDDEERPDTDALVEGIDGSMIRSRYDWKMFITWYQDILINLPNNIKVIDAKDQGAKIPGTIVMPLSEAMDTYYKQGATFTNRVESLKPTFSDEEQEELVKGLRENFEAIKEIRKKSREAISICEQLISESKKNFASSVIDQLLKKLEKINEAIIEQPIYGLMNLYVNAVAAYDILKIYQFTENIETSSIQTFQRSKCIFESIIKASNFIEDKLDAVWENM